MKNILIVLLVLCLLPESVAQIPVEVSGTPDWRQGLNISNNTLFYEDETGENMPFAEIKQHTFQPFQAKKDETRYMYPLSTIVIWLRFRIDNTSNTDSSFLFLETGRQGIIELFDDKGKQLDRTGTYLFPYNVSQWKSLKIKVLPSEDKVFYVKITNKVRIIEPVTATLHTSVSLRFWFAELSYQTRWLLIVLSVIGGGLLIMSLFALIHYFFNKDVIYLYYTSFCFVSCFFVIINTNYRFGLELPLQLKSTNQILTFFISFFYVLFISKLMDLPKQSPQTWFFLKIILAIILIQFGLAIYEYFNGLLFRSNWVYVRQESITLLAGMVLFVKLWQSKSPLKYYLMAGSGCLWVISYYYLFTDARIQVNDPALKIFVNYLPFFFGLGALLENFFFFMALAYRNRLSEIEKLSIQSQYAIKLEKELAKRTEEIKTQVKLLEEQKVWMLEAKFEQRIAETEMTALRAQMNPHFIFNCLNSIKLYTLENDSETASEFLSKFSRLIRLVLENSRSEKITLENELETLRLYIELEAMRFKNKVKYDIILQECIDEQFLEIPPLLIQPFVENAIWHGLMHKDEGGKVSIDISQPEEQLLQVEITDDGVGRELAGEYKSKSATLQKSFGVKMTSRRIDLINQLYQIQTEVKIIDLKDENGKANGTKVILAIPL